MIIMYILHKMFYLTLTITSQTPRDNPEEFDLSFITLYKISEYNLTNKKRHCKLFYMFLLEHRYCFPMCKCM